MNFADDRTLLPLTFLLLFALLWLANSPELRSRIFYFLSFNKKRLVIGQQMADARQVEALRLANDSLGPSPMPSARYRDLPQGQSLMNVSEMGHDRQILILIQNFVSKTSIERAAMTATIDMAGLYELIHFANRCALLALREQNKDRCKDGLRALAMLDLARIDPRDPYWPLAMLDHAALKLNADREGLIRDAERIASLTVGQMLKGFREKDEKHRSLKYWGFAEVITDHGLAIVHTDDKKYQPLHNLLQVVLDISELLNADRYIAQDPEIATDIAPSWFKAQEKKRIDSILSCSAGTVRFHATMRADFHPLDNGQRLICWISEFPEPAGTLWLAKHAMGKFRKGGAAMAMAEGNLLCLIVGHSFFVEPPSVETTQSLNDLLESFRPVLAKAPFI